MSTVQSFSGFLSNNILTILSVALGGAGLSYASFFIQHIFLILISKKYQLYLIDSDDIIQIALTQLAETSSMKSENGKPYGLFYGKDYIGYVESSSKKDETSSLKLFCPKEVRDKISQKIEEIESEQSQRKTPIFIDHLVKIDRGWCCKYKKSQFNVADIIPCEKQLEIINNIKNVLIKNKNRGIFIVHGKPGTGKSFMSFSLAKELNASLCRSYNPTKPHDTLLKVYFEAKPTKAKPLIIVIDEIDLIFKEFHKKRFFHSKPDYPQEVYNKESWNRLCDDLQWGFYPNTIIIGTMNESPNNIKRLDQSYIRDKRVNAVFSMDNKENNSIKNSILEKFKSFTRSRNLS